MISISDQPLTITGVNIAQIHDRILEAGYCTTFTSIWNPETTAGKISKVQPDMQEVLKPFHLFVLWVAPLIPWHSVNVLSLDLHVVSFSRE